MLSPAAEVVITGVGMACPIGIGQAAVEQALESGTSAVHRLPHFDTPDFPVRMGAEVSDFDPKQYVTPRKSLKVMSRSIQLAFASAQLATQQANLAAAGVEPERFGVVFGADMIQVEPDELTNAFRYCIENNTFDVTRWDARAISELYPLWMLKYLPNMPACHVAIALDARGPNNTIVLAEASSLLAIAEGARVIERGHADMMIVGGTGSRLHPLSWAFRDNEKLHSCRWEQPESASRPFDAKRDGMVYGEGAAAFVIESRQHAVARRAKILARIAGFASTFQACTPGESFPGRAVRLAISQSLKAAGLDAKEIGHVNAHGLSTVQHDREEAGAIREKLGDVPVTAPKSFFGNLGGGTGAVELLASMYALEHGRVPHTLNYEYADPECPINVVQGSPLEVKQRTALVLNQTTMGQSVAMVLSAE
ncbi:MAG TPA: beta-ketoacyl-[acyl-carrier-protein] synthase family protein [Pirellulales bacterium]|jgi:3-oxoacyl-[acyl-carrier-protein] synthase II|nr:beta-ketoacyl-[acyl-carrier-protein] synthase family protein [Pirellulales bacterium]